MALKVSCVFQLSLACLSLLERESTGELRGCQSAGKNGDKEVVSTRWDSGGELLTIKRRASWDEFSRARRPCGSKCWQDEGKVNLVGQPSSASDLESQSFESVASEKGLVHFCRFLLGSTPPALCCARMAPALTLETFACCPTNGSMQQCHLPLVLRYVLCRQGGRAGSLLPRCADSCQTSHPLTTLSPPSHFAE